MRLTALTQSQLVAHGVDRRFATVLADPKSYHADLDIIVGRTNWDYAVPVDAVDIVPLWDSNSDSVVRWHRESTIQYGWLRHDEPGFDLIATSEQGVMAKLWQIWIEFQDADANECERFADAIGFSHWRHAMKLLDDSYTLFDPWIQSLTDTNRG
jgi:hypothetical protein